MDLQLIVDVGQVVAALTVVGGIVVVTWTRRKPWVTMLRDGQAYPKDSEWFQRLAGQLQRSKCRGSAVQSSAIQRSTSSASRGRPSER